MKKQSFFALLAFTAGLTLSLSSCKKEESEEEENTPTPTVTATISIEEPTLGATYEIGDTVHVHADITCPTEMHGYSAHIENVDTGAAVWTVSEHVHGTSFHVEGFWVNNVTSHSDMKLVIEAEIDHDGTTTTKEVSFHCHPM
jgi:hypothetical protein